MKRVRFDFDHPPGAIQVWASIRRVFGGWYGVLWIRLFRHIRLDTELLYPGIWSEFLDMETAPKGDER